MTDQRDSPVGPKAASWFALVFFAIVLIVGVSGLVLEDLEKPKSDEIKTVETTQLSVDATGKRTTTTTTQKSTSPVAEPSAIERLASPGGTLLAKLLVLFAAAFLIAAATQRVLLGRYAVKIAGVEVPEILPAAADSIGDTARSLARQPARTTAPGGAAASGGTAGAVPENREPEEDVTVDVPSSMTGLVQLRFELERVLRSLAVPQPIHPGTTATLIGTLTERGVLPSDLKPLLTTIVEAGDRAAAGSSVPPVVRTAAEQSGPFILQTLAQLRRRAAPAFEDLVLEKLKEAAAPAEVNLNASIGTTQCDAMVRHGDRSVVVEVRARLSPTAAVQLRAVRRLVRSVPRDVPLILVVLGVGVTPEQQAELNRDRPGGLEIVRWDEESAQFRSRVRRAVGLDV